jgi:AraC family L-rhamnose operon regulatory protein RhaS
MEARTAIFKQGCDIYRADTCEPLKKAAREGRVRLVARARGAYPGLPLPARELKEVRSVGYWDADYGQDWGLGWHRNEGLELMYISRGRVSFGVDRHEGYTLGPGDLTITRPWQLHRVGDPNIDACRLYWVILDLGVRRPNQTWRWPRWLVSSESDTARLTTFLSQNEQPVWRADGDIEHYFEKLGEATADYNESRVRLYISGLLVALTELLERHGPTLDKSLPSAQRTVELFLRNLPESVDHPWDLASMAAECGLARSQFTHYCRRATNSTPIAYLARCRVDAASRLLTEQPRMSITEVALRCGFESSQYFARLFHEQVGCSPRDFRRRASRGASPATHSGLKKPSRGDGLRARTDAQAVSSIGPDAPTSQRGA